MPVMNYLSLSFSTVFYLSLYLLNFFAVIAVIFIERRSQTSALLWAIVLLFVPVFGFIFYLFLGKGPVFGRKKKFLNKYYADSKYSANVMKQLELFNRLSDNTTNTATANIIKYNMNYEGSMCTFRNHVRIYTDIKCQYDDMIRDIENAEHFVNVLYFIIQPDKSGDRLKKALIKKAKQGVDVKLVYDDVGCKNIDKRYFQDLIKAGGKVVKFFPSRIKFLNLNLNYRNHRKIVVIDNKYGYMGGANIGDEYIGQSKKKIKPWRDTHLKISGEAVFLMNLRFMQDFNFSNKDEVEPEPYNPQCVIDQKISPIQFISDGPDSVDGIIESCYIKAIYSATKRIYIQTPYLIPDEVFLEALKAAARSGIDVRIMIPGLPDKPMVYACSLSYAAELAETGCKIFLWNGFIHSKTLLIDDDISSVGSFNIDIRSFKLNFEMTAFLYDEAVAQEMLEIFMQDMENSREYTMADVKNRSIVQRMKERVMRLLSPLF